MTESRNIRFILEVGSNFVVICDKNKYCVTRTKSLERRGGISISIEVFVTVHDYCQGSASGSPQSIRATTYPSDAHAGTQSKHLRLVIYRIVWGRLKVAEHMLIWDSFAPGTIQMLAKLVRNCR